MNRKMTIAMNLYETALTRIHIALRSLPNGRGGQCRCGAPRYIKLAEIDRLEAYCLECGGEIVENKQEDARAILRRGEQRGL